MKSLSHLIAKLGQPCLITPARHAALCQLLESHLAGQTNVQSVQVQTMPDGMEDEHDQEDEQMEVGDTAIIQVHGTLVAHPEDIAMSECGCAMEDLNAKISAAEENPAIKRVLYDFRTPGGTVTMIPETARRIRDSRKETIAFTDSECCSGGLWLAAQCQRFYATQSSNVGSVGVYCLMLDYSRAMEKRGVKVEAISAGKYKLLGAYWKPLGDDERAILQAGVDKTYAQFKEAMETWRMVSDEHFGSGLVFDGEDAARLGFTDGCVDCLEDVLDVLS